MIFAVLPVKAPSNAKQRLSGLLSSAERTALARAMYEEVLAVLMAAKNAARGIDQVVVATSDEPTAHRARRAGALVFEEQEQLGHSHSANAAARRAMALGARTVLLLPIDVPLVQRAEIEELAAAASRFGAVIVPSFDGTGTNALALTPPDLMDAGFGPNSFVRHLERARATGATVEVLRPPGLVLDIDTPEDAAELLARAPQSKIAKLLLASYQPSAVGDQQARK